MNDERCAAHVHRSSFLVHRSAMAQEIEIKFPLKDRLALVRKLHEIGAQRLYAETFEDNIVLDRRGELRTRGALLRVRKFGRYALATFKGPTAFEGGVKTREEVQTGVESFELAIQLFDSLGFKPTFRYQKFREVWRVREVEVVLDRTPIGDYFEIEGPLETIRAVAEELGMNMEAGIRQSYADLYRQARRTRADLPENMVFPPEQLPSA
jgi:adenylate cyclase, class 2